MLPKPQEEALFELFDACALSWRKVLERDELPALRLKLATALTKLELHWPCSLLYIKTHNMLHMVDKIEAVGPLYLTSMFPFERSYKALREWIKNRRFAVQSLAKNVAAFVMSVLHGVTTSISFATAALYGVPEAGSDTPGEAPFDVSALSPYTVLATGDWSVETGMGRQRKAPIPNLVSKHHADFLTLHHLTCEFNQTYRDLWQEFMEGEDGYLARNIAEADHPEWVKLDDGDVAYSYFTWDKVNSNGEPLLFKAILAWKQWQPPLPLTPELKRLMLGPAVAYYKQNEITICGVKFKVTNAPLTDLVGLRDSIVLRGTHNTSDKLYFGVLREIRMFLPAGAAMEVESVASDYNQAVLRVDWLEAASWDTALGVPLLTGRSEALVPMPKATVKDTFPGGSFVHAQSIVPISNAIVRGVRTTYAAGNSSSGGSSGSSRFLTTKLFVLHRDPDIRTLSLYRRKFRAR